MTWKYLLHEKLDLPVENMHVVDRYEDVKKTYEDFLRNSNMLDLIDVYNKCRILTSNSENKDTIAPIHLRDFLSGKQCEGEDEATLPPPTSPQKYNQGDAKVKLLAKTIFFSYLNLLVNSKNDLALAHVLNIPDRGLGREAFTDLKHAAREKQMSIFLMATSFIRRIELGGKGYAPSPSDPLRTHVKGLSNFINFIDKLHEILGEIPNPSIAGGRILSVIKMQLIKGQSSEAAFCKAVEEVAQDLDLRIKNIVNSQQEGGALGPTDISPARPKSHAINHGTAYCGRDTVKTFLVLLDEEAASAPTRSKAELLHSDGSAAQCGGPSVLTLFRSPKQVDNSPMKPLRERISKSVQEKKVKMKQTLIRSQFSCTYKDDCMIIKDKRNNVNLTSKPLCVLHMENNLSEGVDSSVGRSTLGTHSGNVHLDRSKNDKVSRKSNSQTGNKSSKRKQVDLDGEYILHDNGNEPPQHKNVKIPKMSSGLRKKPDGRLARGAKGSKCAVKTKLITGQTKLTQFFML
ncbi:PREDICTED: PCNA-interacting partner isoform X2 [Chinchilla lanigera]|nr:PREDICTED: PCNA-interacting partner isoform X2 [Chinchilla lanigera]XP_005374623.1 PREDICTED: PCNA-interacting partner isoform X2 [Chinchilla lanigera]XP_013374206.1 PREDICTED: PCNA-interacting partner isoform X2 [Chinchilla lanigera]